MSRYTPVRPGSRPRGNFARPYARSIQLSPLEYVLVRRFADREGLAFGAGLRELAVRGLLLDAETSPLADPFTKALAHEYFGARVDEHLSANRIPQ